MLGNKKPAQQVTVQKPTDKIDTLIGPNTELTGDVVFTGGLRVDGRVTGNVSARESSDGSTLTVSEQGEISGNVSVPHVVINGIVNGNVTSNGKVMLQSKAKIVGDVYYKAIEMELGATVNGSMVCEPAKAPAREKPVISNPVQAPVGEKVNA